MTNIADDLRALDTADLCYAPMSTLQLVQKAASRIEELELQVINLKTDKEMRDEIV